MNYINLIGWKSKWTPTCESSCEPTWPLPCDGVCVGLLRSGCCCNCRGATVHFRELEHQFGWGGGASSWPLFQRPDLCEGNLFWGGWLGVWWGWLCLVPTGRAARAGACTAWGACIQDDSSSTCGREKDEGKLDLFFWLKHTTFFRCYNEALVFERLPCGI